MFIRKVSRVGNSLCVVLPSEICDELKIYRGDMVEFKIVEGSIERYKRSKFYMEVWPVVDIDEPERIKIND